MEWISVKNKLPKKYEWVLVKCTAEDKYLIDPEIFVAYRGNYDEDDEYASAYGDGYVPSGIIITHWMPLPKPPKD